MTDITMRAGNTRVIKLTITDDETGLALPLTNCRIKFKAARHVQAAAPLFEKFSPPGTGIVITSEAEGKIEITLGPEDTMGRVAPLQWECDVFESSGRLSTVVLGRLLFDPTLIRAEDLTS